MIVSDHQDNIKTHLLCLEVFITHHSATCLLSHVLTHSLGTISILPAKHCVGFYEKTSDSVPPRVFTEKQNRYGVHGSGCVGCRHCKRLNQGGPGKSQKKQKWLANTPSSSGLGCRSEMPFPTCDGEAVGCYQAEPRSGVREAPMKWRACVVSRQQPLKHPPASDCQPSREP